MKNISLCVDLCLHRAKRGRYRERENEKERTRYRVRDKDKETEKMRERAIHTIWREHLIGKGLG